MAILALAPPTYAQIATARSGKEIASLVAGWLPKGDEEEQKFLWADLLLDSDTPLKEPRDLAPLRIGNRIVNGKSSDKGVRAFAVWWYQTVYQRQPVRFTKEQLVGYGSYTDPNGNVKRAPIYQDVARDRVTDRLFAEGKKLQVDRTPEPALITFRWWGRSKNPVPPTDAEIRMVAEGVNPFVVPSIAELARRERKAGRPGKYAARWAKIAKERKGTVLVDALLYREKTLAK